ncbi:putative membrane protein [Plasmodium gaboni]|uniref:Putative membrane protein n=1 Tax=Plasmodium gaboni TaxID=647221 RepID=A0A151LE00_9APIC|nr:putative membrane protein [Plasmodium gaboni]KYN97192.1 putative membrane protein [Plasmodium gaboni]
MKLFGLSYKRLGRLANNRINYIKHNNNNYYNNKPDYHNNNDHSDSNNNNNSNSCLIYNPFIIKFYLYNNSKINIDVYIKLISLLNINKEEDYKYNNILNSSCFKDSNLILYKYFQYVDKKNGNEKIIKLLSLLYSKNIREYQDKNMYLFNSSIHLNNIFFKNILKYQDRLNNNITTDVSYNNNIYSMHTDFFLFTLDFYLYYLSRKSNMLNIKELNIISEIYSNINITINNENCKILEENKENQKTSNIYYNHIKDKQNICDHYPYNDDKNICSNYYMCEEKKNNVDKDKYIDPQTYNNKICLLFIYISSSIVTQTYKHIMKKENNAEKKIYDNKNKKSLDQLVLKNINECKHILYNNFINKNVNEQYIRYIILRRKYFYKYLNINVLKKYLNSIKYLNIINIKKYFYYICYLYYNSYIFNKSIYYSSLIFYLLQKYNLHYTYIYHILLIKFNLFLLYHNKIYNDYNRQILFYGINKYIDSIIISRIKKNDRINTIKHMSSLFHSHNFYNNIYGNEYVDNESIHDRLFNKVYIIQNNQQKKIITKKRITKKRIKKKCTNLHLLQITYFEYLILNLFKYLYKKIPWVHYKNNNNKLNISNINYVNTYDRSPSLYIYKKYADKIFDTYTITMSENYLSNIILLTIYIQTCMPILFSYIQKLYILEKVRIKNYVNYKSQNKLNMLMRKNHRRSNVYKKFIFLNKTNGNMYEYIKEIIYNTYKEPMCNDKYMNIFIYKKINRKEKKIENNNNNNNNYIYNNNNHIYNNNNNNHISYFLSCIYNLFKKKILENNNMEEYYSKNIYKTKYIDQHNIFNNIRNNKKNKIKTSLTHYYISSNIKNIYKDNNLYNEKNILTFFCDIYFNNHIIEIDGPKHFYLYYNYEYHNEHFISPFILKNIDIFNYKYLFPFFFNSTNKILKNIGSDYYIYNDKSIKKNFFLYICGYFIKHINYKEKDITDYKYLYNLIYKKKSDLHIR